MKRIAIIGATSLIAQHAARCFAQAGAQLFLAARDPEKLHLVAEDLKLRGASAVETYIIDMARRDEIAPMMERAIATSGGMDAILVAYGTLSNQAECEHDIDKISRELQINFMSVVTVVSLAANYFENQKKGCLAVIGSVAGDRARRSNYLYGTAKGATALYLQGVRARLCRVGASVVTIKPGFVDSPMTAHLKKNFLFADPARVGRGIYGAMLRGRDIVYLPWFWRWVMLVIRCLPEGLFKKGNF